MNVVPRLIDIESYLQETSHQTIREARREMQSGMSAFPPQVGTHYEAFWLRDFAYMLEGNPGAFTVGECIDACRLFTNAIGEDGACVDCVAFDGTPIFMPGYGTMGGKPVTDGGPFTIDVVWNTWKKTGDLRLVAEVLPLLDSAAFAMPRNAQTGLMHISGGSPRQRCPYGFTDTVLKEGDLLFSSLLAVRAYRQLAELHHATGNPETTYSTTADSMANAINDTLWDDATGLYIAATDRCAQHDIWGSAYAVYLGIPEEGQRHNICSYFITHCNELTERGQIRHLPSGTFWEATSVPEGTVSAGTYQNGGYWATPTGWFCYAVAQEHMELAIELLTTMIEDFTKRGIHEWISGDQVAVPGYVTSVALPLAAVRRLRSEAASGMF